MTPAKKMNAIEDGHIQSRLVCLRSRRKAGTPLSGHAAFVETSGILLSRV
ncbi:MAG: hypothetical protein R3C19_14015 [Planctomycetaceae bacterium]